MAAERPSESQADYGHAFGDLPSAAATESHDSSTRLDDGHVIWSDRAFRATFDQAAVGMAHVALDGRWLVVNHRLCDIVGYTHDELRKLAFQDITYPDDLAADLGLMQRLLDGEIQTYSLEKRYIRKDGAFVWINLTASLVRAPDGVPDYFVAVVEDIDARKRLEQERDDLLARERAERETAEARLQQLRRLLLVSDAALSSLGLDELAGALLERVQALMAVDYSAILLLEQETQSLHMMASRGLEEEIDADLLVPLGQGFAGRIAETRLPLIVDDLSTFPVVNPVLREQLASIIGVPLVLGEQLLGVLHVGSATPRRFTGEDAHLLQLVADRVAHAVDTARAHAAAEQALVDAEARARELEAVFETVSDRLIVYNSEGSIVRLNRSAREALPFNSSESYAQEPLETRIAREYALRSLDGQLLPMDAWPVKRLLRGEVLKDGQAQLILMRGNDGRDICMSVTGAPLKDADGHIIGAVGGFHDITALVRAAERERAQRMVAHELSVPLADASMRTHILVRLQDELPDLARRQLAGLERAIEHIKDFVTDLRDVASLGSGTFTFSPEPCDLRALCAHAVEARRLATGRVIMFDASGAPVFVRADPARLEQVLANLLSNAFAYSEPSTSIWVRLEEEGGSVRVSVHDEGVGIAPEHLPYLFDEFYRVTAPDSHATGGGLGLGLYICKALVERQGGAIGVESVPGAGSLFWFSLPMIAND